MTDLFSQPGMEGEANQRKSSSDAQAGAGTSESQKGDTDVRRLFNILERLLDQGILSLEDVEFPRWLRERQQVADPAVLLAAAHLTALTRQGHVGTKIPLEEKQIPLFGHSPQLQLPARQRDFISKYQKGMAQSLKDSPVVGSSSDSAHPLIFDRGYLYYQRYWSYEVKLAERLQALSSDSSAESDPFFGDFDAPIAGEWIEKLLLGDSDSGNVNQDPQSTDVEGEPENIEGNSQADSPDENNVQGDKEVADTSAAKKEGTRWQRLALWMALRQRLLVLTGGPGTGKTYTLIRLVALQMLLKSDEQSDQSAAPDWQVALAAPTGKAAARINESVAGSIEELEGELPDHILQQLPTQAHTIHRLLGPRRNHPEFRHDEDNPLPHDVVIVDEASMVDIALMTKLVEALKPSAQLILIGDKDQLASVEAGSVLGDICTPLHPDDSSRIPRINTFSTSFADQLPAQIPLQIPDENRKENSSPLLDCMVELTYSRRFENAPEIGRLAENVNRNQPDQALKLLQAGNQVSVALPESLGAVIEEYTSRTYVGQKFIRSNVEKIFECWREFQVLCAHRRGPRSADSVNRLMDEWMRRRQLGDLAADNQRWYPGRPIMITENNYELGLFNGDIGIAVQEGGNEDQIRILFEKQGDEADEGYRSVAPAQLSRCEPAWALTVHKSQGSEFDQVLLIMPARTSPILTRELIYTALTRARHQFTVWSEERIFKQSIRQQILRTSALGERVWERKASQ